MEDADGGCAPPGGGTLPPSHIGIELGRKGIDAVGRGVGVLQEPPHRVHVGRQQEVLAHTEVAHEGGGQEEDCSGHARRGARAGGYGADVCAIVAHAVQVQRKEFAQVAHDKGVQLQQEDPLVLGEGPRPDPGEVWGQQKEGVQMAAGPAGDRLGVGGEQQEEIQQ